MSSGPRRPVTPPPSAWPTSVRAAAQAGDEGDEELALADAQGALARAELRLAVAAGTA